MCRNKLIFAGDGSVRGMIGNVIRGCGRIGRCCVSISSQQPFPNQQGEACVVFFCTDTSREVPVVDRFVMTVLQNPLRLFQLYQFAFCVVAYSGYGGVRVGQPFDPDTIKKAMENVKIKHIEQWRKEHCKENITQKRNKLFKKGA